MLDRKKGAKFQGVVAKFQQQLSELLAIVESSETHFVRCIKPNQQKQAKLWEDEMVGKQLRCSGIMEAVRVIAAGYPDRVPHSEILGRFAALIPMTDRPSADKDGEKAAASKTLALLKLDSKEYVPGNTKMFLKAGVLNKLRTMREQKIYGGSTFMQVGEAAAAAQHSQAKPSQATHTHLPPSLFLSPPITDTPLPPSPHTCLMHTVGGPRHDRSKTV